MNRLTALMLCSAGLLSSCVAPPPPPPPCPPVKKAWCPPAKPKPAPAPANPRLRQVGDRVIEDVPPEEVEPVRSVLDIKR